MGMAPLYGLYGQWKLKPLATIVFETKHAAPIHM